MIPSIGRLVHYTLTAEDAEAINKRRADAQANLAKVREDSIGYVLHVGNIAVAGQVYPMLIVRVWGDLPDSCVNGQVFLDGTDSLWVTSVGQGDGPRHWREAPRV
ncbi:hypothetical protein [Kineosporia sp. R_H_3]|uniref:hypothetical protein n=1 Tax=Kineosporia sp. R_H_3 TaxID=1961848 RepID=UPI000B4BD5B8|nr:hypothetical protein [Kineosporia sp. R_H_3]